MRAGAVVFAGAVLGLVGASLLVAKILTGDDGMGLPEAAARDRGTEDEATSADADDEAEARTRGAGTRTLSPDATRDVQPADPFALLHDDELAHVEAFERARFVGMVRDFDGRPCPGATIFHRGRVAGLSDELGRYRVEVAQNTWNPFASTAHDGWLAAVKPGVGAGATCCDGSSRRIDLSLEWRSLFAGRCVARITREPLPLAEVDLLANAEGSEDPIFLATMTCDETGSFRFFGAPPGMVELRARAKGFASDGWFPFDVPGERDRTGIEFQLELERRLRGWFAPWPPSWIDASSAKEARVVGLTDPGRESGPPLEPAFASVDADGRFDLPFSTTIGLELLLEAGGGALWRQTLGGSALGGGDVDLGRIELPAPVTIVAQVDLPAAVIELGLALRVRLETDAGERRFDFPFGADGTCRATPLPRAPLSWTLLLGDDRELCDGCPQGFVGEGGVLPDPGAVIDLGILRPDGALVAGRVLDEAGAGATGAIVTLVLKTRSNTILFEPLAESRGACDAQGRYFFTLGERTSTMSTDVQDAFAAPVTFVARRRHDVARSEPFVFPADGTAWRVDLVLAPGRTLRGRVLDEEGQPLSSATIEIRADPAGDVTDSWFAHLATPTADDGTFEAFGLEDGDYLVSTWLGRRRIKLGRVRPGGQDVTLSLRPGG